MSTLIASPRNRLEQMAIQARLDALGLTQDGQGDVTKLKTKWGITGGAALEAVAPQGKLTSEGLESLEKRPSFFGSLVGSTVSDAKHTQAVQALTLAFDGLAGAMASPKPDLDGIVRRATHATKTLNDLVKRQANLGKAGLAVALVHGNKGEQHGLFGGAMMKLAQDIAIMGTPPDKRP